MSARRRSRLLDACDHWTVAAARVRHVIRAPFMLGDIPQLAVNNFDPFGRRVYTVTSTNASRFLAWRRKQTLLDPMHCLLDSLLYHKNLNS